MCCSHERLLWRKIEQLSSYFIYVCCYRPCPKIMLFDHIDPEDGKSKLQNFNFSQFTWHHIAENMNLQALMLLVLCFRGRVGLRGRGNLFTASAYCPSLQHGWTTITEGDEKCQWILQGQQKAPHIGCDTSECYILWGTLALIQKWKTYWSMKYLVSSNANICNESDVDFSVGRWLSLDSWVHKTNEQLAHIWWVLSVRPALQTLAVGSIELSEVTFREPKKTNQKMKQR